MLTDFRQCSKFQCKLHRSIVDNSTKKNFFDILSLTKLVVYVAVGVSKIHQKFGLNPLVSFQYIATCMIVV